jgi:hypothetical protein
MSGELGDSGGPIVTCYVHGRSFDVRKLSRDGVRFRNADNTFLAVDDVDARRRRRTHQIRLEHDRVIVVQFDVWLTVRMARAPSGRPTTRVECLMPGRMCMAFSSNQLTRLWNNERTVCQEDFPFCEKRVKLGVS